MIGRPHPKISYLIDKLKDISVKGYNNLIGSKMLKKVKEPSGYNVYSDIYNFIIKIKEKNNNKLCIKALNELEKIDKINLKNICLNLLKELLYINYDEDDIKINDDIDIILEDSIYLDDEINKNVNNNILVEDKTDDIISNLNNKNENNLDINNKIWKINVDYEKDNLFDIEMNCNKKRIN